MLMHPVLLFREPRGRERLRATEKSAIMRWSQACRRAASMHVGIVLTVWPYVRDACFLFVASTFTRYCPGFFLVRLCVCVIHPPSPLFSSSLTLSLSQFPFLTHSLPLCKYIHFTILCLPPLPFSFSIFLTAFAAPHSLISSQCASSFSNQFYPLSLHLDLSLLVSFPFILARYILHGNNDYCCNDFIIHMPVLCIHVCIIACMYA